MKITVLPSHALAVAANKCHSSRAQEHFLPIPAFLHAAQPVFIDCRPSQLRLSLSSRNRDSGGMSYSGIEVSIRNSGPTCIIPVIPKIAFLDARGRSLPAIRCAPVGMYPEPVMITLRLMTGHRASTDLRWVSSPIYPHSRSIKAAGIAVSFGSVTLRAPSEDVFYGKTGEPLMFDQSPLSAMAGMAAD
jgi:hypothetical protein